jgi:hypothetical protein
MTFSIVLIVLIFAIIAFLPKGKGIDPILGIYKVVTHPGRFHADETSAIGAVKVFNPNVIIERRVPTSSDLNDPCVLVLDIGRKEDYAMMNCDHHQGMRNPAACVMVLNILPLTDMEKWILYFKYLDQISKCDIGVTKPESYEYNGIVSMFNTLKGGFDKAVDLGENAFRGFLNHARSVIKTADIWNGGDVVKRGNVAIYEGDAFLSGWELFAEVDGIDFLIKEAGKRNAGCWQVIARDSNKTPIGVHEDQVFRHANAFLAIYTTKESAIAHICG